MHCQVTITSLKRDRGPAAQELEKENQAVTKKFKEAEDAHRIEINRQTAVIKAKDRTIELLEQSKRRELKEVEEKLKAAKEDIHGWEMQHLAASTELRITKQLHERIESAWSQSRNSGRSPSSQTPGGDSAVF